MKKEVITTQNTMNPTGPYSQGIALDFLLFIAGQTAIDPETEELVTGGIENETHQALQNLKTILEAGGSSLDQVLKTTVFLKDMQDFDVVNSIYITYFSSQLPARTCLQVSAMPKGAMIEIEAIAFRQSLTLQ